jgi:hypothetical protein
MQLVTLARIAGLMPPPHRPGSVVARAELASVLTSQRSQTLAKVRQISEADLNAPPNIAGRVRTLTDAVNLLTALGRADDTAWLLDHLDNLLERKAENPAALPVAARFVLAETVNALPTDESHAGWPTPWPTPPGLQQLPTLPRSTTSRPMKRCRMSSPVSPPCRLWPASEPGPFLRPSATTSCTHPAMPRRFRPMPAASRSGRSGMAWSSTSDQFSITLTIWRMRKVDKLTGPLRAATRATTQISPKPSRTRGRWTIALSSQPRDRRRLQSKRHAVPARSFKWEHKTVPIESIAKLSRRIAQRLAGILGTKQ